MDEPLLEDAIADAGPRGLHGSSAPEVRADDSPHGGCRRFTGAHDSFIYVPFSTLLDTMGTIVVEADIMPDPDAANAIQTIVARWGVRPEFQSWILFLSARDDALPDDWKLKMEPGRVGLLFALQTDQTPDPQVFAASHFQPWNRSWNHVAVSVDGNRISFYVNGRLDSSFPCFGHVRRGRAPLTIGNFLESSYDTGPTVWTRGFHGTGFTGAIDEVRISPIARERAFVGAAGTPAR